jgi:transcriptional regulator with XRE-family HTH domain
MGDVVKMRQGRRHAALASAGAGYRSGRNSWRGTPETLSTASTRNGGTSSHCEIAWIDMPSGRAKPAKPPAELIALLRASLRSVMIENSSMALPQSQATLHCTAKGALYALVMTLGQRIKAARERLDPKMTQKGLGERFGISDKAVSAWERDDTVPDPAKIPQLRRILKVPYAWLFEGDSPPPAVDAPEVAVEDLAPAEQAAVRAGLSAMVKTLQKAGRHVA